MTRVWGLSGGDGFGVEGCKVHGSTVRLPAAKAHISYEQCSLPRNQSIGLSEYTLKAFIRLRDHKCLGI